MGAVERTSVLMVIRVVIVPADILPASFVDAANLLSEAIYNVLLRKGIGKCSISVCCKEWHWLLCGLYFCDHSVCSDWVSKNIFLNHNCTSFQGRIAFFLSI